MQRVISYHPLTERFKAEVERQRAVDDYVTVSRLRNLGVRKLLPEIGKLRCEKIAVAIENRDAQALAAPLLILSWLSRSREIEIIAPDLKIEKIGFFDIAKRISSVIGDQLRSRVLLRKYHSGSKRLALRGDKRIAADSGSTAILYLDANLSFGVAAGGSVGHIKGVMDGFANHGFAVDYASARPLPTDRTGIRSLEVDAPTLYSYPAELNYYTFNNSYERSLRKFIARTPYAFLYQRMSLHNFSGARMRSEFNIPLVLEYNGSEAWAAMNWSEKLILHDYAVLAERSALRNADVVVTVSEPLREEVLRAGVDPERVVMYPNCIDPAIFDPGRFDEADRNALRAKWGIPPTARVATFIGTFGTWHGVDFLARAIRRLVTERRSWLEANQLHFLLVGDGLKMGAVKAEVGGEEFRPFVTLTGLVAQHEAPAYLAASDIFLATHLPNPDGTAFFGSPTKLFEYMAMERPIVAANLDQIGEVLGGTALADEVSGDPLAALFMPGDENAFLEALSFVIKDRAAAMDMARRAREVSLARFTWEHHVASILGRLKDLNLLEEHRN
jgi:glycosyltransferase involved in cell wall biosynthesis